MAFLTKKVGAEGEFPLTPLVDVMFNLLIFVVVTAQYSNIQSLKVSLPKAQTGVTLEEAESVVVTLTREEKVFVNNDSVSMDRLKEKLSPLAQKEDPPRVLLQADEGSSTGGLVKVMDLVQQAGLKKISIETRK